MFSVQKVVQAYKANMNFNESSRGYKKLPIGFVPNEKQDGKATKKKFDAVLERAMKRN